MSDKRLSELGDQIAKGQRFREVLDSEPWRYVLNRAQDEIDAAVQELKAVEPNDAEVIRSLQTIIQRNEGIGRWLREVLDEGDLARELIEADGEIEQGQ